MAIIYCPECGKQISDQAAFCVGCGCPMEHIRQVVESQPQDQQPAFHPVICPKCGCPSVSVQAVNEKKPLGFLRVLGIIILTLFLLLNISVVFSSGFLTFIFGGFMIAITVVIIVLLIAKGRKYETHSYFVCQSCGNRWEKPAEQQ